MSSKQVLIIGGVALGPKVASRLKRLQPDTEVTIIDAGSNISYGGCGIPYFVSGEVGSLAALKSTTYGTERTPEFFRVSKDINVLTQTKVLSIDRQAKTILIENLRTNTQSSLAYDQLVLATGSKARGLQVPGVALRGISNATTLEEAAAIHAACASGKVTQAVVVGGSFIGLEMAVAIAEMWDIKVKVVEFMPQLLPGVVSESISDMAKADLEKHGVEVFTSEKVLEFKGDSHLAQGDSHTTQGNAHIAQVITDKRTLDAQLVVLATGAIPNTSLAESCGLTLEAGGIWVNEQLQTSDPNIYAGGDCISLINLITKKRFCLAMGSLANRQGRIIGTNLAALSNQAHKTNASQEAHMSSQASSQASNQASSQASNQASSQASNQASNKAHNQAKFSGAIGTFALKLFEVSICGTGLSILRAKGSGFDSAISASLEQFDRAHFYPEKDMMHLELVVEASTRRILGLQGCCNNGDALKARIDAVATLLQFTTPTIDDLEVAEVAYAPPFASAMDILNSVANAADNMLSGQLRAISSHEFSNLWNNRDQNQVYFLDARPAAAGQATAKAHPRWHSIPLEEIKTRYHELPTDKPIAIICNIGLRAYETMLLLEQQNITNTTLASGGMQAMNKRGCGL